ncbi:MAG: precorrin-8X methylmutase [Thermodesulfovibrionales bacterium]
MDSIILIGHGSPLEEANNLHEVAALLHPLIHPGCKKECVRIAYLQFGRPHILETIEASASHGAKRIIIHPFFLSKGLHVTKDIPEIIEKARSLYPDIEFLYTEPLGFNEGVARLAMERIKMALFPATNLNCSNCLNYSMGERIERESFKDISEEFGLIGESPEVEVIKRVIHATADPEFKETLLFAPDAIRNGIEAIKKGKDILTDVEMVRAGIKKELLKPFGGRVLCYIENQSERPDKTRAELAIEYGLKENPNTGIIAIGNAPTALLKVIEIFNSPIHQFTHSPILVIGVPVGFVNALESKLLLSKQNFPFITNHSRKGGSTVAVAIVNALLKLAMKEEKI